MEYITKHITSRYQNKCILMDYNESLKLLKYLQKQNIPRIEVKIQTKILNKIKESGISKLNQDDLILIYTHPDLLYNVLSYIYKHDKKITKKLNTKKLKLKISFTQIIVYVSILLGIFTIFFVILNYLWK